MKKMSAGNPQHDQLHLVKTNPLSYDNYFYFIRASTSTDFAFQAPRCQDSFRSSFHGPKPSFVQIRFKLHTLLETLMPLFHQKIKPRSCRRPLIVDSRWENNKIGREYWVGTEVWD